MLQGDGKVAMSGVLVPDEMSPSGRALRVSWRPSPTHGATVRGACSADFKRSIEEMYLTVSHGAEFALPQPGGGETGGAVGELRLEGGDRVNGGMVPLR
ncbi:MAG: hypothetical protein H0T50_13930 [Gemmatimonadales bacterium]|nr:hypothetical protein [Gemmatimonadales bacterium]